MRELLGQMTENAGLKKRVDDQGHDIMSPVAGTGTSEDHPDKLCIMSVTSC